MKKLIEKYSKLTEKEKQALNKAFAVLYFDDNSDFRTAHFRTALWEVVSILLDEKDIYLYDNKKVYDLLCS